jgi:hypothetical protein
MLKMRLSLLQGWLITDFPIIDAGSSTHGLMIGLDVIKNKLKGIKFEDHLILFSWRMESSCFGLSLVVQQSSAVGNGNSMPRRPWQL